MSYAFFSPPGLRRIKIQYIFVGKNSSIVLYFYNSVCLVRLVLSHTEVLNYQMSTLTYCNRGYEVGKEVNCVLLIQLIITQFICL